MERIHLLVEQAFRQEADKILVALIGRVGNFALAEDAGTRVTFILHCEPKGLSRLMDPMITRTMQGEVATLANLKMYLEGQPG